jgi:TPR repeat protein
MRKILCILLAALLLLIIGCAPKMETTGVITHGEAESAGTDSITALRQFADTDPAAACDLGLRYLRGDGVPQDSWKGVASLRAAAEHGDLQAQAALGKIYLSGLEEMGSDPMEATKWLRLAADQGDSQSKALLKKAEEARKAGLKGYTAPSSYGYSPRWYWQAPYRYKWNNGLWTAP